MHTLGMIFAWTLVVMFAIGFCGSMVIAVIDLWDGIGSFFIQPESPSLPSAVEQLQEKHS